MALLNVRVGTIDVPLDLNDEIDVLGNVGYIAKQLGFDPKDIIPLFASVQATKYQIKPVGGAAFAAGTSLRTAGYHGAYLNGGTDRVTGNVGWFDGAIRAIEMFDPLAPIAPAGLYPNNRFPPLIPPEPVGTVHTQPPDITGP